MEHRVILLGESDLPKCTRCGKPHRDALRATCTKCRYEANKRRKARHEALTSLGLVRVKGALGRTYYE